LVFSVAPIMTPVVAPEFQQTHGMQHSLSVAGKR
jgi:hypothetical protein